MQPPHSQKKNRLTTPIFVFDDYVDYLKAWYAYAKRFGMTQAAFMKLTKVGSQAYFSDIISRRKKLSVKHIRGFIAALGLRGDGAAYFSSMVKKHHAASIAEREKICKCLCAFRGRHLSSVITNGNAEYFSSWKYPLIREYIVSCGYVASLKDISRAFLFRSMPMQDIRRAVYKLIRWNMVDMDGKNGGYRPKNGVKPITYSGMPHAVVNDVKRFFIESSVQAMENLPKEDRHVSMAIRGMSRKRYEQFCQKIDALRREFLDWNNETATPEFVYGLNVQMFPLLKTGVQ